MWPAAGARAPGDPGCFQRCTPRRAAGALVSISNRFGPAAAQNPCKEACAPHGTCSAPVPWHRAITGPAAQPLTCLPRGQWPRAGGTRGRPAFGRGTSSEIRALSRRASVAEKNSARTSPEGVRSQPRKLQMTDPGKTAAPTGGVRTVRISDDRDGQRLDNFLLGYLKGAPRSLIYKIVRSGQVRVNGGR